MTRDILSIITSRSCALHANSRNSFHLISLAFFLSKLYYTHPLCFLLLTHSTLVLYLKSIMQLYVFVKFIVKIPLATHRKKITVNFYLYGKHSNVTFWEQLQHPHRDKKIKFIPIIYTNCQKAKTYSILRR